MIIIDPQCSSSAIFVCFRRLRDEVENYEASVKKQSPAVATVGGPLAGGGGGGAVCEICHKTKFADGVGNKCHYCSKRSCSRCGGKITLRNNKVRTSNEYVRS